MALVKVAGLSGEVHGSAHLGTEDCRLELRQIHRSSVGRLAPGQRTGCARNHAVLRALSYGDWLDPWDAHQPLLFAMTGLRRNRNSRRPASRTFQSG